MMQFVLPFNYALSSSVCKYFIKAFKFPLSCLLSNWSTHSFQRIGFNYCITAIPPFNQINHSADGWVLFR